MLLNYNRVSLPYFKLFTLLFILLILTLNMYKINIGTNAGIIYNILTEKGKINIRKIGELTHLRDSSISMALGWLARENKIQFSEINGETFIDL